MKIKDSVVLEAVAREIPGVGRVVVGRKLAYLAQRGELVRVRREFEQRYRLPHAAKEV